jgi:hypothetical protein
MLYFYIMFQKDPLYGFRLTFFAPWLPWQWPPFWTCSTPNAATHYGDIPTQFHDVWWKKSNNIINAPFSFHGNCDKVCPTDSIFFGLSRSTRCGCCSYQVSSISVRRVNCYGNFCVFNFFAFWPFPWQRQPFWKKSTLNGTTSHGTWYSYNVS